MPEPPVSMLKLFRLLRRERDRSRRLRFGCKRDYSPIKLGRIHAVAASIPLLNVVILHYHPGKGPPSPGAVTITTLSSVLQPQPVHPPEPPQPEPP